MLWADPYQKLNKTILFFILIITSFIYAETPNVTMTVVQEESFLTQYFWREVITLPPGKRPKIALVLSGGGARGLAHIGALKIFEEEGFPIDMITSTSIGALVGALYCSGLSIEKIEAMAEEIGWGSLTNVSVTSVIGLLMAEKLLSTENMEKYIAENIGNKKFHELKIPFICIATDLKTGEKIIFREGDVASAVRASATIPGVFSPVEYRHRLLVDGGLVDNIPTDVARMAGADIIIAIDIKADFTRYSTANVLLALNQSIYIQGEILSKKQLKLADIVISPNVGDVAAYELWRYRECIDAGIVTTRKLIRKIKELVMEETYKCLLKQKK